LVPMVAAMAKRTTVMAASTVSDLRVIMFASCSGLAPL
jgi:hypothetical protein